MKWRNNWPARYALALAAVALGALLRLALTAWGGPGLPTYITFYPAVMAAALLAGTGPGLLATVLSALISDYWLLEPAGFGIANSQEIVGQVLFSVMGLAISWVAGLYRRTRNRLAHLVAERTKQLNDANAALKEQVALVDPARAEIIAREMQRVLHARRTAADPGATVDSPDTMLRHVPAVAGTAIAVLGALTLVGWLFDIAPLKSILPMANVTMTASTALCFLLTGAALILRERRTLRLVGAALVGAVALLALAQHVTGFDLHIDRVFVSGTGSLSETPVRMAPVTALCFGFAALSLALTDIRSRAALWAQQAAALAVGTLGLTASLGYLYTARQLYAPLGLVGMAPETAVAFIASAGGFIFARRDGLIRALLPAGVGAQFARRLLPAVLIVPVIIAWLHVVGETSGLVGPHVGAGLVVLAMILSLAGLVWWTASALSRVDAQRLETETQLREQARLMDQTIESLIVREMDGAIRFWNRGAEALYGWSAAEALGQRIHVLLRTEGLPPDHEANLERIGHWEGELIHTARGGRRVIVESRKTGMRAGDGRFLILESNRDVTERRRAEQALRQSEERLQSLYASMVEGLVNHEVVYEDGKAVDYIITDVNPAFEKITGLARSATIGRKASSVYGTDVAPYLDVYAWVAAGGPPAQFETFFAPMEKHFSISVFSPEKGRFATVFSDITERRKAEETVRQLNVELERRVTEADAANEALRNARRSALNVMEDAVDARQRAEEANKELHAREDQLKRAQEIAHLGSWDLDLIHNRLTWSDEVYRIFGLRPHEFAATYEAFLERVHPDDRAAVEAAYSDSLRENRDGYEIEHRVIRQGSGEVRIVRERCEHIRDNAGRIVRSIGMVHDLTELRQLQDKDREDAARLARVQSAADTIDVMREGVVLATRDGVVLSANPAVELLTGLVVSDLPGRKLEAVIEPLVSEEDMGMIRQALESVRAGRIPTLSPLFLCPAGGQPVCVLPNVRFMGAEDGGIGTTVVLTFNDITQLFEAEEKLRVTGTLLRLFVDATSRKEYLDAAVGLLRDWSGCRCVGIRVADDKGLIPYEASTGFSREFLDREGCLSLAADRCVCSRIAMGTPAPQDRPAMTPGGSFCSGDAAGFAKSSAPSGKSLYRGTCARLGFASLAVVPIRHQDRILGAIHLADEGHDRVNREAVELLESMALMIGEAIHRFSVERELRESEYRHRLLVEHVPAVTYTVVLHDRPTTTYISPQIQSLLGLSTADVEADPDLWVKQIHAGDRDRVLAALETAIRDMRPFESEYRLIARDGREVWVHDSAVPIASEGGRPAFLQGVMYDITGRKKAEADRVRHEARLKSLAAALSITEEENRWKISRQIHDTVVQSLSLSNIKLGALRREEATADLADRQKKIDGIRELLNEAVHEARSLMTDLTPPLLYEMGLEPALRELAEHLSEKHGLVIEVAAEESLPATPHAVRGFLFASARELIMNALKHAGSRRIGVALRAGVGELVLQVSDDGRGFESEPMRVVLDTSAGGFGLFSIRERAEGLGGKFSIESEPGKGATLTLTVPLKSEGEQGEAGRGIRD